MTNIERLEALAVLERQQAEDCGRSACYHMAVHDFRFMDSVRADAAFIEARRAFHHAGNVLALEHASMLVYSHDI